METPENATSQSSEQYYFYIGTYTRKEPHVDGKAEGIYTFRFDWNTKASEAIGSCQKLVNPSYLTVSPSTKNVYAACEVDDHPGTESGRVVAFSRNLQTGELTHLNDQSAVGKHPCFLSMDAEGKVVMAANYSSGDVAIFGIESNGALKSADTQQCFSGSSVNKERQESAHAHSVYQDPWSDQLLVADLGCDLIHVLDLKMEGGKWTAPVTGGVATRPGSGPRHLAFHPQKKVMYCLEELDSTVTVFAWSTEKNQWEGIQTLTSLSADFSGINHSADLHVHPTGQFLYASNRGEDHIAIYRIDTETGSLSLEGHQSCGGKHPRNFAIAPNGKFMVVANQNSDNVVIYAIDESTGSLTAVHEFPVLTPVCVQIVEATPQ